MSTPHETTGARPANLAQPASLADGNATTGGDDGPGTAAPPLPVGRYLPAEEIAHGGMGVVYRATDTAFGREVAIKVLQERFGPDSGTARRFADEARITAQLQHPGIPPVHDLGVLPDGRPFLVMKLIKGETLDQALRARPDPAQDRGRFVEIFEKVCQAVAYAHARRVIHRDLKPANVMVGSFGEVQVMDWGLAKVLTASAPPREGADPEETSAGTVVRSMRESDGSDGSFTQAGSILGTPSFMPPEQAAGEIARIDERADVFGLGALLAVILTGQPPYSGPDAEAVRIMAIRGDRAECLARLEACAAEPELVDLCRRCLAFAPADRPADAGAVAREVEAFRARLADQARRAEVRRAEEAAKASERRKRRRVWVGAAAAVAVAVVGGLGTVLAVQTKAKQELVALNADLTSANADLTAATARERERFELALRAVRTFHTGVSEDVLLRQAEFADLREKLLRSAREFYERLERSLATQTDLRSRVALARAYTEIGRLTARIGSKVDALAAYRRSADVWQSLADRRSELAHARQAAGELLTELGRDADAEAELTAARDAFVTLAAERPGEPGAARDRAAAHRSLAAFLDRYRKGHAAQREHRQAIAACEQGLSAAPGNPALRCELAHSLNGLGWHLQKAGSTDSARAAFDRALGLWRRLADDFPHDGGYRISLAAAYRNAAFLVGEEATQARDRRKARESVRLAGQALELLRPAAGPTNLGLQVDMAQCHDYCGKVLMEVGADADALAAHRRALALREPMAERYPSVTAYQLDLARSLDYVGILLWRGPNPEEGVAAQRKALAVRRAVADAHPADHKARSEVGWSHHNIGYHLGQLGPARTDDAIAEHRLALGLRRKLAAAHPGNGEYVSNVTASYRQIGWLQRRSKRWTEAAATYREAIRHCARSGGNGAGDHFQLACLRALLAESVRGGGGPAAEAKGQEDRAITELRKAVAGGFRNRQRLTETADLEHLRKRADFQALVASLPARPGSARGGR